VKRTWRVGAFVAAFVLLLAHAAMAADVEISIQNFAYHPNPARITISQSVGWTNQDVGQFHTASSRLTANGVRFFDTGTLESPVGPAASGPITPGVAGKFVYFCAFHLFTGVLNIPVVASSPQVRRAPFPVTWASVMPANYVEDVQVKKPGATRFTAWVTGSTLTGAQYTAGRFGVYKFRARLRSTDGNKSAFSPPIAVRVA